MFVSCAALLWKKHTQTRCCSQVHSSNSFLFQRLQGRLAHFQFTALILMTLLVFRGWFWRVYSFSSGLKWKRFWMVSSLKGVFHFYPITFQNNKQPSGWLVHTCPHNKGKWGGEQKLLVLSWEKVEQRAWKQRWRERGWAEEQMNARDASAICCKVGQPLESSVAKDQIGIKVLWLTVWAQQTQPPPFQWI